MREQEIKFLEVKPHKYLKEFMLKNLLEFMH